MTRSPPTIGFAVHCYYWDTSDRDAWKCRNRNKLPPCYYCANAPGKANEAFRKKAKPHPAHRCAYEQEVAEWEKESLLRFQLSDELIPGYETDTGCSTIWTKRER
jgi:hypothetical protein